MEILRAKTLDLRQTKELSAKQKENSILNEQEALSQTTILKSFPRRFVLELTNACNLNCIMCGRNAANFKPVIFDIKMLDKLQPVAEHVEEVTLMGWGEPTLHPQFADFLKWAKQNNLRKYFCSNGMMLGDIFNEIIENETDIIAVSMDGASEEINNSIRTGADFHKILKNIEQITTYKAKNSLLFPYMNFVITVSKTNLKELPELIRLAKNVGLDEVKVVYLTAFDDDLAEVILYQEKELVQSVFQEAMIVAKELGIFLKLPHLQGEDPAGNLDHKDCYTAYRDFFLGSDGYVRPCMSSAVKFLSFHDYQNFDEMWNHANYQAHRKAVNKKDTVYQPCQYCYQSSFANWNKESSFLQNGKVFSPEWGKE